MGKRWVVLLVIALVGILSTLAYADKFMVVVIDVDNGKVEKVYGANSNTLDGAKKLQTTGEAPEEDVNKKTLKIKKKEGEEVVDKTEMVLSIPDYTVIRTHGSPGCVTYTYGNYSWTVCNP